MGMKNHSWPLTIRIIVFSCLIGGAAGVLGTALTTSYLSQYALQLGEVRQTLGLSQIRPRTLPQSYADALERLEARALPAVGSLFAVSRMRDTGVSVFDPSVPVMVLTSDGWMLSTSGGLDDIVSFGAQTCDVDKVVVEPRLGFTFLHCATSETSVVDIIGGFEIAAGDQLFVVSRPSEVVSTHAREIVWGDAVRSSDIPSRRILLGDDARVREGAAVFNVFGEFVGVARTGEEGIEVVPFEELAGAFVQVLESIEPMTYPSLGVRGIDLARTIGVDENFASSRTGFLLYGSRAAPYGSAAYKAGLLVGDILLTVDGVAINGIFALDDLLTSYYVGNEVQVELERDGERQTVTVMLGELEL